MPEGEVAPRVGGDQREERRPDGDEQVRPEARLALPQLPLDPDRTSEPGRDPNPDDDLPPREIRHAEPLRRRAAAP